MEGFLFSQQALLTFFFIANSVCFELSCRKSEPGNQRHLRHPPTPVSLNKHLIVVSCRGKPLMEWELCLSAGRECHPNPTKMLISLVTEGRDKYTKGSLFVWSDGVKIRTKDNKTMGLTGSGINSLIMIQMACLIHADCVMRPNSTGNVRNR